MFEAEAYGEKFSDSTESHGCITIENFHYQTVLLNYMDQGRKRGGFLGCWDFSFLDFRKIGKKSKMGRNKVLLTLFIVFEAISPIHR